MSDKARVHSGKGRGRGDHQRKNQTSNQQQGTASGTSTTPAHGFCNPTFDPNHGNRTQASFVMQQQQTLAQSTDRNSQGVTTIPSQHNTGQQFKQAKEGHQQQSTGTEGIYPTLPPNEASTQSAQTGAQGRFIHSPEGGQSRHEGTSSISSLLEQHKKQSESCDTWIRDISGTLWDVKENDERVVTQLLSMIKDFKEEWKGKDKELENLQKIVQTLRPFAVDRTEDALGMVQATAWYQGSDYTIYVGEVMKLISQTENGWCYVERKTSGTLCYVPLSHVKIIHTSKETVPKDALDVLHSENEAIKKRLGTIWTMLEEKEKKVKQQERYFMYIQKCNYMKKLTESNTMESPEEFCNTILNEFKQIKSLADVLLREETHNNQEIQLHLQQSEHCVSDWLGRQRMTLGKRKAEDSSKQDQDAAPVQEIPQSRRALNEIIFELEMIHGENIKLVRFDSDFKKCELQYVFQNKWETITKLFVEYGLRAELVAEGHVKFVKKLTSRSDKKQVEQAINTCFEIVLSKDVQSLVITSPDQISTVVHAMKSKTSLYMYILENQAEIYVGSGELHIVGEKTIFSQLCKDLGIATDQQNFISKGNQPATGRQTGAYPGPWRIEYPETPVNMGVAQPYQTVLQATHINVRGQTIPNTPCTTGGYFPERPPPRPPKSQHIGNSQQGVQHATSGVDESASKYMDDNDDETAKPDKPLPVMIIFRNMDSSQGRSGDGHLKRAWEAFRVKVTYAQGQGQCQCDIDTSVLLIPCIVQFALQERTGYTQSILQETGIRNINVTPYKDVAGCEIQTTIQYKTKKDCQEHILSLFVSITEGLDYLEIPKDTGQYDSVIAEKREDILTNVRDKAALYSSPLIGLYIVGDSEVVQSVGEMLGLKGHVQAARSKAVGEEEEESTRKRISQFNSACDKLEQWINSEMPVVKSENIPEDESSCKDLHDKIEKLNCSLKMKLETEFQDLVSVVEKIRKAMSEAHKMIGKDQTQQQRRTQIDKELNSVEQKFGSLQQSLDSFSKGIEVKMAWLEFVADCDKLDSLIDKDQGLLTVGDISSKLSVINNAADKLNNTEFGTKTEKRRALLNKKWETAQQRKIEQETAKQQTTQVQDENMTFQPAWGSVQLYTIVQKGNKIIKEFTVDATDDVDPLKIQFVLESNKSLDFTQPPLQGSIYRNGDLIECDVFTTEQFSKEKMLEAINDQLRRIENQCLPKISCAYNTLTDTPPRQIGTSKKQNHVEVFEWNEQLHVVGKQRDIEKFLVDLGISKEDEARVQQETVREGQVEDDKRHTDTGRPGTVKRGTESESDIETGHIAGDLDKTQLGDHTMMLERGSHAVAKEALGFDSNADTPKEHTMKPEERREEAGANTQLDKERLQETGDQHSGFSKWMKTADQNLLNQLGQICVRGEGRPVWQKTNVFFDRYKLYFGLAINKSYMEDKLRENKVEIHISANGIECLLRGSRGDAEALRCVGNIIQEKVLSDYESIIINKGSVEEEVFRQMLKVNSPVGEVMVFSHDDAGCLCMVGEKEDVAPLIDEFKKQTKGLKDDKAQSTESSGEQQQHVIQNVWEDLNICIEEEDDVFNPSEIGLCPYLIQFVVAQRWEQTTRYFNKKKMKISLDKHQLKIKQKHKTSVTKQTIGISLKEDILYDLDCYRIQHKNKIQHLTSALQDDIPFVISEGRVVVYKNSIGELLIVGGKSDCEKALKDTGLQLEATDAAESLESVQHSKQEYLLIQDLEFLAILKEKGIEVEVNFDRVVGKSDHIVKYKRELQSFKSKLSFVKVEFRSKECEFLLFDTNGDPNEHVHQYFRKKLQTKGKSGNKKIHIAKEHNKTVVKSLCSETAKTAALEIVKSINFHQGTYVKTSFQSLLKDQSKMKALQIIEFDDTYVYKVACLQELSKQVLNAFCQSKTVRMPETLLKFFTSQGSEIIDYVQNQFEVSIKPDQDGLCIFGVDTANQGCKKYLKQELLPSLQRMIPLDVTDKEIQKIEPQLHDLTSKQGCCLNVKHTKLNMQENLDALSYLTSWWDPLGPLNITAGTGLPEDINFELLIVNVNNSLFPVGSQSLTNKAGKQYINMIKETLSQRGSFAMGDVIYEKVETICPRQTALLVVRDMQGFIDKMVLKEKIAKILKFAYQQNQKSVGIDASEINSIMRLQEYLKTVSEAIEVHFKENQNSRIKVFITCDDTIKKETMITLGKLFNRRGLAKKDYDIRLRKDADISVKCSVENLHEAQVDILVNPASKRLDLQYGQVSKMLLKNAGNELQVACKKLYPHGIKVGEVALTEAYNLKRFGCQFVFHSAPPEYDNRDFRENIKKFVRTCLYMAECQTACTSIAFPAIGVGTLEYPRRDVAKSMFDAIDEFRAECIEPKLQQIKLVLYHGDKETLKTFQKEEWRRSAEGRRLLQHRLNHGHTVLRKHKWGITKWLGWNQINVVIIKQEDIQQRPSSAVVVEFTNNVPDMKYKVEEANADPVSYHDKMLIGVNSKYPLLDTTLESCFDIFEKHRITEVILISCSDSAQHLCENVKVITDTAYKWSNPLYLLTICIAVKDSEQMKMVFDKGNTKFQTVWIREEVGEDEKDQIFLQLIGKPTNLDTAEQDVTKFIKKTRQEITQTPGFNRDTGNDMKPQSSPQEKDNEHNLSASVTKPKEKTDSCMEKYKQQGAIPKSAKGTAETENDDEDAGFEDYGQIFDKVSAEVNTGIIRHIEVNGNLADWIADIEKRFKLQTCKETKTIRVEGSLDAICSFQEYLDNDFLANIDENIPDTDVKTENEDISSTYVNAEDGKEKDEMKKHFMDGCKWQCQIGNLGVQVYKENLKHINVDCIGLSSQSNLQNESGVAFSVTSAAGIKLNKACEDSMKKGSLRAGECRLLTAGDLTSCKKLAFICMPTHLEGKANEESVISRFATAILNCFREVDKSRYTSVALPCLGTGIHGFSFSQAAEAFVRALNEFTEEQHYLKHVHIVDTNAEGLVAVSSLMYEISQTNSGWQHTDHSSSDGSMDIFSASCWTHSGSSCLLYPVSYDISAMSNDAVVSPEDEKLSGKGAIAKRLLEASGNSYKLNPRKLQQSYYGGLTQVADTKIVDGSLPCRFVLHAVVPTWNGKYSKNRGQFHRDVKATVKNVLVQCSYLRCQSLALPLLGKKGKSKWKEEFPYEICCKAMLEGLEEGLQETNLSRIDFCSFDKGVLIKFGEKIRASRAWKREETTV